MLKEPAANVDSAAALMLDADPDEVAVRESGAGGPRSASDDGHGEVQSRALARWNRYRGARHDRSGSVDGAAS